MLLFSFYFYIRFNLIYAIPLLLVTLLSYYGALIISKERKEKQRKLWFIGSLTISVSLLAYFKIYSGFGIKTIFQSFTIENNIAVLAPIGISFYTFQAIAYIIDVYRGRIKAENSLSNYSLFLSFFPQVLAGPIERAKSLLPQLKGTVEISAEKIHQGLKIFLWGFYKKVLVADKLSLLANPIFNQPASFNGIEVLIGIISYSFQIYCDFSGYCDMGVGVARALGIDLSVNFYKPYTATSLRDFWQRWHITLTKWFRTFVYIPLGGSKGSLLRRSLNLSVIFLISSLWHGFAITFLIWGGIHCLLFIIERVIYEKTNFENKIPRLVKQVLVFSIVSFAWIFFRAPNLGNAVLVIKQMTDLQILSQITIYSDGIFNFGNVHKLNIIQATSIALPFFTYIVLEFSGFTHKYFASTTKWKVNAWELFFYNLLFLYSLFFIAEPNQQFIYFKF